MQYVGQTRRALQKRFGEHYRRMKKPKLIDTFLFFSILNVRVIRPMMF